METEIIKKFNRMKYKDFSNSLNFRQQVFTKKKILTLSKIRLVFVTKDKKITLFFNKWNEVQVAFLEDK